MDKNYTPKARKRRIRKLLESPVYNWAYMLAFRERILADGGSYDEGISLCVNQALWKLIYN